MDIQWQMGAVECEVRVQREPRADMTSALGNTGPLRVIVRPGDRDGIRPHAGDLPARGDGILFAADTGFEIAIDTLEEFQV